MFYSNANERSCSSGASVCAMLSPAVGWKVMKKDNVAFLLNASQPDENLSCCVSLPHGWRKWQSGDVRQAARLPSNRGSIRGNAGDVKIRTRTSQSWFIPWPNLHVIQVYSSFLHLFPAHQRHCMRQAKAENKSFQIMHQIDFYQQKRAFSWIKAPSRTRP